MENGDVFREVMSYMPSASSITGMLFYSFIVFLFLTCLRKVRNDTLYPEMVRSMNEASQKQRELIRKKRSEQAQELASKLE